MELESQLVYVHHYICRTTIFRNVMVLFCDYLIKIEIKKQFVYFSVIFLP